ncbi:MAG TPA: ABC transporter ATP-binding protein [Actinomycetota bacterium]|nr:ABC transporter ATP-binding protein [Actinomycetota bacterium]
MSAERDGRPILELKGIHTSYGPVLVLQGIDLEVRAGECVTLLGPNAAGKTTTLRTILGMVKPAQGQIFVDGERVDGLPTPKVVSKGVTMVPENRRLFARMSVKENLEIGANLRSDQEGVQRDMEWTLELFPRLRERLTQRAGTLSGGEQQMLAIARALMAGPKVLLMDEPSMGLAPILVEQVFDTIRTIREQGTTIFLVEQNAKMALSVADRGYVLRTGEIVLADRAANLRDNPEMEEAYLGG